MNKIFLAIFEFSFGAISSISLLALIMVLNLFTRIGFLFGSQSSAVSKTFTYTFGLGIILAGAIYSLNFHIDAPYVHMIINAFYGLFIGFLLSSIVEILDIFNIFMGKIKPDILMKAFIIMLAVSKAAGAMLEIFLGGK